MARSALLNVMVQAVFKAGKSLSRDFGEVQNLQVSLKGPAEYVAQAGRKAEKVIREELMKSRPTYGYLGEEGDEIKGTDGAHRWIVDPLDGTTNFLHGIPFFAISVALERNGEIVGCVVFNPGTDELYTAERGGGAFLNDRRLRVAARKKLSDAVIATGTPYLGHGNHGSYLIELRHVMGEVAGIRSIGAASLDLAYVAAGRFDGFWVRGVDAWDIAAGMLLVREAGGWVSDIDGGNNSLDDGTIVAGKRAYPQGAAGRDTPARPGPVIIPHVWADKAASHAVFPPSIRHKVHLVSGPLPIAWRLCHTIGIRLLLWCLSSPARPLRTFARHAGVANRETDFPWRN